MGRIVSGIDLDTVPPQFEKAVPGRVLILDGDGAAYRAAATAKTLPTAVRRFFTEVLTCMFLADASSAEAHLTAAGGSKAGRGLYPAAKPYQGNRTGKSKPPLLEPLRQAVADPETVLRVTGAPPPEEVTTILHTFWEADDGMIQSAEALGANGVIRSDDKDLRMTTGPYYEIKTGVIDRLDNPWGWIDLGHTPAGAIKPLGHGRKFFWFQLLMGDTADNIAGIRTLNNRLCGPASALDYLANHTDENACANAVLWEFAKIKQDVLAEAELLWLRRSAEDSAYAYLSSLDLHPTLRNWVDQLHQYHMEVISAAQDS